VAINTDTWQQAKAMFEGGSNLSEIADKTGIYRSTISKKAKCQAWQKAMLQSALGQQRTLTPPATVGVCWRLFWFFQKR
jgi:uncharacterized protein YerC